MSTTRPFGLLIFARYLLLCMISDPVVEDHELYTFSSSISLFRSAYSYPSFVVLLLGSLYCLASLAYLTVVHLKPRTAVLCIFWDLSMFYESRYVNCFIFLYRFPLLHFVFSRDTLFYSENLLLLLPLLPEPIAYVKTTCRTCCSDSCLLCS